MVGHPEHRVEGRRLPGAAGHRRLCGGDRVYLTTAVTPGPSELPKKDSISWASSRNAPRPETQWKVVCLRSGFRQSSGGNASVHQRSARPGRFIPRTATPRKRRLPMVSAFTLTGQCRRVLLDSDGKEVWSKPLEAHKDGNGWGRRLRRFCTGTGCTCFATTPRSLTCWRWTSAPARKCGAWDRDERSNWVHA